MRLPRDVSGERLARLLERHYGYERVRQVGSHLRLTCELEDREHHITIPLHRAIRVGTLGGIIGDVAVALGRSSDDVAEELFGDR